MIVCSSCGEKFESAPPAGTPCRICGAPVGTPPDEKLEVDPQWEAERARKQAAAAAPVKKKGPWGVILSLVLLAALVASCLYLVKTSYESRRLFAELDRAANEQRQLEVNHSRLEAERQAQATHLRVDKVAREKLAMRTATPAVTQYVELSASGARP